MLEFISALPKTELHVHLVGSASVDTVLNLARQHPERGVPTEEAELRRFYEFTDFDHFIDVYIKVNRLVTTGTDVTSLVVGLAADLARNNVRYAEVTVTATSHLAMGITAEELAEALELGRDRALTEHSVLLGWVFDSPGLGDHSDGLDTADFAVRHRPAGTVGIGIGGPELGIDRERFKGAFDLARDAGLHSLPHAGETTGPATVWAALRALRAERIGHGTSAVQDPRLLDHLAEHGIAVEVCPTSNLRTNVVRAIEEHPLPRLLEAGVTVTVATDDPGMFHTDLNREYLLCHEAFGLGRTELADLARAGVRAAFCPPHVRVELLAEIDAVEGSSARR
ncbi:adenosine deaminase [Solihabitans fulvus]|uniref:Adenosine deaminase n=1 Tax=Solihabitans fulvus TaxID=1892852 RepID=A0A5B2WW39_9PSEU|nr:adenosine deaminase [Solihabitans fulvus]KAA2254882.1 adenosine deaminase [Solihabitans fulvus]